MRTDLRGLTKISFVVSEDGKTANGTRPHRNQQQEKTFTRKTLTTKRKAMKYFRVNNPEDLQVINPKTNWIFINRELYTEKEIQKMNLPCTLNFFNSKTGKHDSVEVENLLTVAEVSKHKTYFYFGARFEQFKPTKN